MFGETSDSSVSSGAESPLVEPVSDASAEGTSANSFDSIILLRNWLLFDPLLLLVSGWIVLSVPKSTGVLLLSFSLGLYCPHVSTSVN